MISLPLHNGNLSNKFRSTAALDLLRPLFADPSVLKIGHNLKYDMVVLRRYDVVVSPLDDTMLMSYILDGGSHGHGMDELAARHLDYRTIPFKDVTGTGKSQVTFDLVPLDRALAYAAEDADVTLRLHRFLKPRLLADRMVTPYETLERPLVPVLADMETEGVRVDRTKLEATQPGIRGTTTCIGAGRVPARWP